MPTALSQALVGVLCDVVDSSGRTATSRLDELASVADQLDERILLVDPASCVLYANPAACRDFAAVLGGPVTAAALPSPSASHADAPDSAWVVRPTPAGRLIVHAPLPPGDDVASLRAALDRAIARSAEVEILGAASFALAALGPDVDACYARVADVALELFGAEGALVSCVESTGVRILRGRSGSGTLGDAAGTVLTRNGSLADDLLRTHGVRIANRAPEATGVDAGCLAGWGVRAVMVASLAVDEHVVGTITVINPPRGGFSARDGELLGMLADRAAIAVHHAQRFRDTTRGARHAAVLAESAEAFARCTTRRSLFEALASLVSGPLGARGHAVLLVEGAEQTPRTVHVSGAAAPPLGAPPTPAFEQFTAAAIATRTPVVLPDLAAIAGGADDPRVRALIGAGVGAMAIFPLVTDGPPRGLLVLRYAAGGAPDDTEQRMLVGVARQLATTCERVDAASAPPAITDAVRRQRHTRSVGELLPGVVHDLNNPLTGVSAFAELLQEDPSLDESAREAVSMIRKEALRAIGIIKDVLHFARPATHAGISGVDVNAVVDATLRLRGYLLRGASIQLSTQLEPELPRVRGDAQQLQLAVMHLLANAEEALAAVPAGRRELRVATIRRGNDVVVSVADNGAGMSPETQRRMFEPFFTTRPADAGAGLGLSIASGIVEAHGGAITVRSEPGAGARLEICFPSTVTVPVAAPEPVS